ncbi:hypothetical protein Abr02nite_25190 [Paractinoplanes brasiliensis]|nr:hypothetical protein Abr02nite_25190 [Actinoplanes brasiliensis]
MAAEQAQPALLVVGALVPVGADPGVRPVDCAVRPGVLQQRVTFPDPTQGGRLDLDPTSTGSDGHETTDRQVRPVEPFCLHGATYDTCYRTVKAAPRPLTFYSLPLKHE